MKITIVSGSPRKQSRNVRTALYLESELKKKGVDVTLLDMRSITLPMIQVVWEEPELVPAEFKSLYETIYATEAFIFVSPEYNGGYSPAMKNLIDHFPKSAFQRKPFGIVTGSIGEFGGMRAALQMQLLAIALFSIPSPRMLIVPNVDKKFNVDGTLEDKVFQASVDTFLDEYLWLANKLIGH